MHRQFLCYWCAVVAVSLLLVLVCLAKHTASREDKSCYADNSNPYIYTSTKTAYKYVNNNITENITLSNCRPIYVWMYCRHGTRYPRRDIILQISNLTHVRDLIVDNHKIHKRGHLCDKDLQNLKNWSPESDLMVQYSKYLTLQGEKDLSTLGERVRERFPELFDVNKPENYKFRSTNTQRTIASMTSFISGAFGHDFVANMEIDGQTTKTEMLEVYKNCQPWLAEINKTKADGSLVQEFINGPEVAKVVADVNRRLGFANNISKEDVFLLYDTCRFEKAWHTDSLSPWCAAFTDDEMRVFEYEEDLFYYYYAGHGLEINKQLGCRKVKDMFDHFAKLEHTKEDEPKGTFSFSHSTGIMLFLTAMGIGKDATPLTSRNYLDMAHRNWRTSLLSSFATNFLAVFYSCNSSFKVAFYLAEKPVTLEGCEDGVCDWTKLKETLGPVARNCNMQLCQGS